MRYEQRSKNYLLDPFGFNDLAHFFISSIRAKKRRAKSKISHVELQKLTL